MIRSLRIVSVLVLLVLLVGVAPSVALAQDRTLYWETYDVDITVQPDGCFRVVETQQLVFTSGTFRFGVRSIPTANTSSISDIAVSEAGGVQYRETDSGEPFTFSTSESGGNLNIRYNFPPTNDDDRTMIIEYTVCGGLLYYDGGDQLVWKAVPSNDVFPIQHASATVHLPDGATVVNYDATGPRGTPTLIDNDQGVRFETTEPIRPGSSDFAVRVQWPHGIVAGQPAAWQAAVDRQDQIDQNKPLANLGVLALTAFLLVVSFLALYLLWYSKGRDAPSKLPAEWIPEPPSDLPSGMVGTLIDERADNKDVISTLVDLARRGVLAIQEETKPGTFGIGESHEFIYHLEDTTLPMRPYEKLLVDKFFGDEQEKRLSDLREKFYANMGQIKQEIYQAVVDEGYFPNSPERTRTKYGLFGLLSLVLAFVFGCVLTVALINVSDFALCLPVVLAVPAIGLIILARYMPRKSPVGAEESAKWLAFKRYMEDIEKYTKVDEVKEIFDRFLPYAIAFGLEQSWIQKFSKVDAMPPPWYYPGPYLGPRPRGYVWWGAGSMGGAGGGSSAPMEGGSPPTLSDLSRGTGAGLAGMSAGLGTMLSSSAGALTSRPTPQMGSGSWGGSSWSGGGGFGGGGWSGGGGFSGGGGGGSSFG